MSQAVGILLYAKLQGDLYAVLQRRGEWNFEEGKPESWAYLFQASAHGGVEDGENLLAALLRETRQELGEALGERIALRTSDLVELYRGMQGSREIVTYGLLLPYPSELRLIRLSPSSGGLRLLKKGTPVAVAESRHKAGVPVTDVTYVHRDVEEALQKGFEVFA